MLARVAERMYWMARYLERAENTARFVGVSSALTLDLPKAADVVWSMLPAIIDGSELFDEHFSVADQRNVVRFMVLDERNPASIACSVKMARENVRTTREVMPTEVWELVNELHHFVRDEGKAGVNQANRHRFLAQILGSCYQFTGMLHSTMSHSDEYRFIEIGRHYERGDMSSRILDIATLELFGRSGNLTDAYENILWMNLLRSMNGYQMYRQHVQDRINAEDVVEFLLKDNAFPRSVAYCIRAVGEACEGLPRPEEPSRVLAHLARMVDKLDIAALVDGDLHQFIDQFQIDYGEFHEQVATTWFGLNDA